MSAGLKLQGQFKFDLYDKSGNLLKSSDYVNNFITQSGLMYPIHFAFADCFRFLSIGDSNTQNSIIPESETVGLTSPINGLTYIGSRTDFTDRDSTKYAPQPSCGYRFPSGNIVELYRMWSLPSSDSEDVFQSAGAFEEFAVSPGRPYVTALNQNNNTVYLCSCNDKEGNSVGKDCSSIADYYNYVNSKNNKRLRICDATGSFARVVHHLDYPAESKVNITYKLTISVETGLHLSQMYSEIGNPEDNFYGDWYLKQGVTQLGLKLINNGYIDKFKIYSAQYKERLQHFDYRPISNSEYKFENEYGESFIPPHGIPLEPSTHNEKENAGIDDVNIVYYLSENNTQFSVSPNGGKLESKKTGEFAPWNLYSPDRIYSSGDLAYSENFTYEYINEITGSGKALNDPQYWNNLNYLKVVDIFNDGIKFFKNENDAVIYTEGASYWTNRPYEYNIRKDDITVPNTGDILLETISSANFHFNATKSNFTQNYVKEGNLRKRSLSKTFRFNDYSKQRLYIKSLIGTYKDINNSDVQSYGRDNLNFIPFLDSLFANKNNIFLPQVLTGVGTYSNYNNTGASISGSNSLNYFYLDANQTRYPIFTDILTWSADCPDSVYGCQ